MPNKRPKNARTEQIGRNQNLNISFEPNLLEVTEFRPDKP